MDRISLRERLCAPDLICSRRLYTFCAAPQVLAQQQVEAAVFDTSRLVDFTESVQYTGPAVQLTPLVREAGCLAVTDARLYFQPLHNVTGDSPVRVFALSDVAAMARRRSSLKPTGILCAGLNFPIDVCRMDWADHCQAR